MFPETVLYFIFPATYFRPRLYIGQNGRNADKNRKGNMKMNMKKLMSFALSAVMVLSLAACGQSAPQDQSEKTAAESNVEIPNPFADCDTMAPPALPALTWWSLRPWKAMTSLRSR